MLAGFQPAAHDQIGKQGDPFAALVEFGGSTIIRKGWRAQDGCAACLSDDFVPCVRIFIVDRVPCNVHVTFHMYYIRMSNKIRYSAFLCRWQEEGDQTRWRSTVENVYTGEKRHFSDKKEMLHFLEHSLSGRQVMDTEETSSTPHDQKEDA